MLGHGATLQQSLLLNLLIFSVFAVPGYFLACAFLDRTGHRRLQLIDYPAMGAMFLMIALDPGSDQRHDAVPAAARSELLLRGFGPNTTTFAMAPADCYPTSVPFTGHRLSAGIAELAPS